MEWPCTYKATEKKDFVDYRKRTSLIMQDWGKRTSLIMQDWGKRTSLIMENRLRNPTPLWRRGVEAKKGGNRSKAHIPPIPQKPSLGTGTEKVIDAEAAKGKKLRCLPSVQPNLTCKTKPTYQSRKTYPILYSAY
jgi:hypothetical protein